jgi:hypothetical protein
MPPDQAGGGVPQHETALPYNPEAQLAGLSEHPAVQQQMQYALQQGASPAEARQVAQQREQEMATMQQSGMPVQNFNQLASVKNPIADILTQYSHGFVSRARVEQVAKLIQ